MNDDTKLHTTCFDGQMKEGSGQEEEEEEAPQFASSLVHGMALEEFTG